MPTRPANTRSPSALPSPSALLSACLTALALALSACSGGPQAAPERKEQAGQALARECATVVVEPVAISADLAKRHARAARICQKSALDALAADGRFALAHHTMPDEPTRPVLLVKSRITDLRLRDGAGRADAPPAEDYIPLYGHIGFKQS